MAVTADQHGDDMCGMQQKETDCMNDEWCPFLAAGIRSCG